MSEKQQWLKSVMAGIQPMGQQQSLELIKCPCGIDYVSPQGCPECGRKKDQDT